MTNIRVTCLCCRGVTLFRPAQLLLLAQPGESAGTYLFLCPVCQRLTVRSAPAREIELLIAAGVRPTEAADPETGVPPETGRNAGRPFTSDDLLDLHLLLADDDWTSRLAESARPPRSG